MTGTMEDMASALEASGNYKVLRRVQPGYCVQPDDGSPTRRAIILDCETTGLDPKGNGDYAGDEIIELGLLPVDFTNDYRIVRAGPGYQSFRQPAKSISAKIEALTGITNAMVEGHDIDFDQVAQLIDGADWIIAHNARFDRRFAEILHPEIFMSKPWACSWTQVDWPESGSGRLGYLVNAAGLFSAHHRALDDCHALLELLARPLGLGGVPALGHLIETAQKPVVRLWAQGAPFEKKDILKARNYRWNPGEDGAPRAWYTDIAESNEDAEITFLRAAIFGPDWNARRSLITAYDRFSDRC
jgi:DNA polymerase-3 subunit epsilon